MKERAIAVMMIRRVMEWGFGSSLRGRFLCKITLKSLYDSYSHCNTLTTQHVQCSYASTAGFQRHI